MTLKYLINKKGNKSAVVIPIKDWLAFRKEHEKLIRSNKKTGKSKKITGRKRNDSETIRNFTSSSKAFSFWENSKENLYQDFLNNK